MATLLSIVQDALVEVGLTAPDTAIGSNDPGVVAMIALVNQTGRELMRRHAWQVLQTEKTFTTVALAAQAGAIPADFDRFIAETFWNRTKKRPVAGPLSVREWQQRQATTVGSVSNFFRQRGDILIIDPVPAAGETMAYEYVSKYWVTGSKATMTIDSDIPLLDDNLLKLGAIWRFLKSKSLDYAEDFRTYENEVLTFIAKDGGKGTISLSSARVRIPTAVVPEGNWTL